MNIVAEQIPPCLQETLKMTITRWSLYLSRGRVEVLSPWFGFTDEVKDFDVSIVSKTIHKSESLKHKIPT